MRRELIAAREKVGLTQGQLASQVGISRSFYAHIELANRNPSLDIAIRIAEVVKKRVEDIFLPTDVAEGHNRSTGTEG